MLGKAGIEETHRWNIKPVEPHHRLITEITVIMKGPRWRDDEVAPMHGRALAVHRGVRAFAIHYKP